MTKFCMSKPARKRCSSSRVPPRDKLRAIVWHSDCVTAHERFIESEVNDLGLAERAVVMAKGEGASVVTRNKLIRKNILNRAGRLTVYGRDVRNFLNKRAEP